MLFNSFEFILVFLPVTFVIYFALSQNRPAAFARGWLFLSSICFYGWWNVVYVPLLLSSIFFNYFVGKKIRYGELSERNKKLVLTVGVVTNLSLLGYFKYADFFLENLSALISVELAPLNLLLPLAISFFTFQQIAYLVDSFRSKVAEHNFLEYAVFVSFFPQLIAGPIVHHSEMMPQFLEKENRRLNHRNILLGMFIFAMGLFKKVIIADSLAVFANQGYAVDSLSVAEAWITSLSYTFQLYYDFSGYTDMAIGLALLFNIRLPQNFNSPYKALSIQDFWRRWHMTLSRFLRDYVYIPLGGNRKGELATYNNLFTTFLLGGLWHGADWMFVIWGCLHGAALVIHRAWSKLGVRLFKPLAWILTFNFINVTWVFFRAPDLESAKKVLRAMFCVADGRLSLDIGVFQYIGTSATYLGAFLLVVGFVMIPGRNTNQVLTSFRSRPIQILFISICLVTALLNLSDQSEFLYFNF
jgi:D-alanyl-lipoteichoic acid acyltransferase DltB (MBOAT superfamily)